MHSTSRAGQTAAPSKDSSSAASRVMPSTFRAAATTSRTTTSARASPAAWRTETTVAFRSTRAPDNTIGGTSAASRNIISGNGMGIYLSGGVDGTTITGNYIGLDVSGSSAIPNADGGVIAYSNDNTITGNVISANSRNIQIIGTAEGGGQNVISGNLIGTDAAGAAALGNSGGIVISDGAHDNVVGGLGGASTRNVISGTRGVGVTIDGADNNTVLGNYLGPDANGGGGLAELNGDAVYVSDGNDNTIGGTEPGSGNVIAFNRGDGAVVIVSGVGNEIVGNSIHDNCGLGIELAGDAFGVTANDRRCRQWAEQPAELPVDRPRGDSADGVIGELYNNALGRDYRIEVFASPSCDSIGGNGEGETFLGSASVLVDGTGFAAWRVDVSGTLSDGDILTATATLRTATRRSSRNASRPSSAAARRRGTSTTTTAAPPAAGRLRLADDAARARHRRLRGQQDHVTYTAADGGMNNGTLILGVPSVGVRRRRTRVTEAIRPQAPVRHHRSARHLHLSGISLAGGETLTITYGAKGVRQAQTRRRAPGTQSGSRNSARGADGNVHVAHLAVGRRRPGGLGRRQPHVPDASTESPRPGRSPSRGTACSERTARQGRHRDRDRHDLEHGSVDRPGEDRRDESRHQCAERHPGRPVLSRAVPRRRETRPHTRSCSRRPRTRPQCSRRSTASSPVGGGDCPEAYNLVFHNSYTPALGGDLGWREAAAKFVVVVGDAEPHGAASRGSPVAPNSLSDGYSTATELAGMRTNRAPSS